MGAHAEELLRKWNEEGMAMSPMAGHDRGACYELSLTAGLSWCTLKCIHCMDSYIFM